MFLRKICIENYRLLKNVEIDLDKSMTVFVGKNNTGKTSVMRFMQEVLGNKSSLSIDDYSLGCHSILHEKVKEFWNNDCACEPDFWDDLPLIKMRIYIDYEQESSEESLGALSDFILDLNDKERTAVIKAFSAGQLFLAMMCFKIFSLPLVSPASSRASRSSFSFHSKPNISMTSLF